MNLIFKNKGVEIIFVIGPNMTFKRLIELLREKSGISYALEFFALERKPITENQNVQDYFSMSDAVDIGMCCAVPGCKNTCLKNPEKGFFKFPTEEARHNKWVFYCQRMNTRPRKKEFVCILPNSVMCSDHFSSDQFLKGSKVLDQNAVPNFYPRPQLYKSPIRNFQSNRPPKNFELHQEKLMPVICKLCGMTSNDFINIFDDFGEENEIAETTDLHLNTKVEMTGQDPKQICKQCIKYLTKSINKGDALYLVRFKQKKLAADKLLRTPQLRNVHLLGSGKESVGSSTDASCSLSDEGNVIMVINHQDSPSSSTHLTADSEMNENDSSEDTYTDNSFHGRQFSRNGNLLEHDNGCYKCSACESIFTTIKQLQDHFVRHCFDERTLIYCNDCFKPLEPFETLELHNCTEKYNTESSSCLGDLTQKNKAELLNVLEVMPEEAREVRDFHDLRNVQDDNEENNCPFCEREFSDEVSLDEHMASSHRVESFTCGTCLEAFPNVHSALYHKENQHKFAEINESYYEFHVTEIYAVFLCEYCKRCFAEAEQLDTHRELHSGKTPFECKMCSRNFISSKLAEVHRESHQELDIPREYLLSFSIPRIYLCKYCDVCFLDENKLSSHHSIHCEPETYQFITSSDTISNQSNHSNKPPGNGKPYECHYCNKSFKKKDFLTKHIRTHTGEKPFSCDQCGKSFAQSCNLNKHKKFHFSERPFCCSYCPRRFKVKRACVDHIRTHLGTRPFECGVCKKTFARHNVYRQHMKIHSEERPYVCDICKKAFRRRNVLISHQQIHTGEKQYLCDICGQLFRQLSVMNRHKRVQH